MSRAYVEMIMGLPFSIHIRGDFDPVGGSLAVQAVWDELRYADRVFSTYRVDSDISRINRGELTIAQADPLVAEVITLAAEARNITSGAFDVRYAGQLDPSGIVKGWAATRASTLLERTAADWYLNAGGDVLLHSIGGGELWRIGIEHPADPSGLLAVLQLTNAAVATSGAAHRGQHIINPATGLPPVGVVQATVTGPDLMWADVFATAIVAAAVPGLDTWQLPDGYEFLLVTVTGGLTISPGMSALLDGPPAYRT